MPTPGSNLPIDQTVIPPAVKSIGANADALQAQLIESLKQSTPQPQQTPTVVQPEPVQEPAPLVIKMEEPQPQPQPQPQSNDPTQMDVEQILALDPNQANEQIFDKLRHAYKSLQGRHKAARERDSAMIDNLSKELQTRASNPPPRPFSLPEPTPAEQLVDAGLTEDEINSFGPDLVEVVSKVAKNAAAQATQSLYSQLKPVIENVASTNIEDREQRCVDFVNQNLAGSGLDFDKVNTHPQFIAWLQLRDAYSGATRQKLLDAAWNSQDGNRVLALMKGFLSEMVPTAATPQPVMPPAPAARQPQVSLETIAAPGVAPRATQPAPPVGPKPIYTRAEVKAFYDARNRGFYKGREEEAAGYDLEIQLAARENRIV